MSWNVWTVPGANASLPAGDYQFQLRARNLQGTYELRENLTLPILGFTAGRTQTDAPTVASIVVAVAAAAFVARRRITR